MSGLIIVHRGSKGAYEAPVWHPSVVYKDTLSGIPYTRYDIGMVGICSEAYLCGEVTPHYLVPAIRVRS